MKNRTEIFTILFLMSVILLAGCTGCGQKTAPEHADPYNQAAFGPVAANSRVPISELPPFEEPSFERLIAQFKIDVAENEGDPELLKRKKEVIANPDLLWEPRFTVPLNYSHDDPELHDSSEPPGFTPVDDVVISLTKDQKERIDALHEQDKKRSPHKRGTPERHKERVDYFRKEAAIMYEKVDSLTAAKRLSKPNIVARKVVGVEYAERAMREDPNSVDAMRIWVKCQPGDRRSELEAYQQLLSKFPNAAFAHERVARLYYYGYDESGARDPDLALYHIKKACQLDSRIAKRSPLLALCYEANEEWEKAVAAFQGMDMLHSSYWSLGSVLSGVQDPIYFERKGYSYFTDEEHPDYTHLKSLFRKYVGKMPDPDKPPKNEYEKILLDYLSERITWRDALRELDARDNR